MDKQEVLRRYFGHGEFREGQEALIDALLAGRDALGIMPTGGGKSLCYQVPALLLPGVTLVISPLIALMKDQVMALEKAGVPAAFLNSSLSAMEWRAVYDGLRQGASRLLYVAPERPTASPSGGRTSGPATGASRTFSPPCPGGPPWGPSPPRPRTWCSGTSWRCWGSGTRCGR